MADSLLFNGTTNYIAFSTGTAVSNGAYTFASIIKVTADASAFKQMLGIGNVDAGFGLDNSGSANEYMWTSNDLSQTTLSVTAANGWVVTAISRADGATTPRFHRFIYGGSWSHQDSTGGANPTEFPAFTRIIIGANGDTSSNFLNASILIAGWWNSALSDGTIETLTTGTQAWIEASPAELWRLDRLGSISSLTGTSTETARVGTSVDVDDVPTGWSDGGGSVSPDQRRYVMHPKHKLRTVA